MTPTLSVDSVFVSRSFWNYYLHPCQKTYAMELAKRPNSHVIWFDPPTRNPRTWLRERKQIDPSGVILRRPLALCNEYENFGPADRFLFRIQLRSSLSVSPKPDLWSIACPHPWLAVSPSFSSCIYWPGDFFEPMEEFPLYQSYDLIMPWTPAGIEGVPESFRGGVFRASTCPGEAFLLHDTSAPLRPCFDFRNRFRKSIVYLGGLSTRRVDFPLLNALAESLSDHALLLGAKPDGLPETTAALDKLLANSNVFLFDDLDYPDLPYLAQAADVGIIPYLVNDHTLGICPNKLFEYAALAKPVVSSPVPAMEQYSPPVRIARNHDSFIRSVREAVATPPAREECSLLRSLAEKASPSEALHRIARTLTKPIIHA